MFSYGDKDQLNYMKIGTKFSNVSTLAESIIGSKSHGKFLITREDFSTLSMDFANHEEGLYIKIKDKLAEVDAAQTEAEYEAVAW